MKQTLILQILLLLFVHNNVNCQKLTPKVVYSTYYGNIGTDDADAVAVDNDGNIYLGCHSNSSNLLGTSKHPYILSGGMDAFIIKLNSKGDEISYLTHLGGSKWDAIQGIISDSNGNIYAVGTTYSSDFPVDNSGFQTKFGGKSDAFVVKLDSNGKVVWSTFLGGNKDEDGRDIAIDIDGNIYIVGRTESNDFPISTGALQSQLAGEKDAFLAKFNPNGRLLTTTFLGGTGNDIGFSIELDKLGQCLITGTTNSSDFPMRNALQESNNGKDDIFFAIINKTGSVLEFSSYWGGKENDQVYSIDIGPMGDIFLMGMTSSSDFPTTEDSFQPVFAGERDAFVTKLSLQKRSIIYSTYLGGNSGESPRNLIVDDKNNAIVVGQTSSKDFPTINSHQAQLNGHSDAFIAMLDPSGSSLIYSTMFGGKGTEMFEGVAISADGSLTLSGLSDSIDFPLVNPIQSTFLGGRFDIVVARLIFKNQ